MAVRTIRDVATAAGVSPSTVSRALSMPEMVDAATRARVHAAADQLGYQPNRAARGLITGRTGNIGLIVPDLANPFFPAWSRASRPAARRGGLRGLRRRHRRGRRRPRSDWSARWPSRSTASSCARRA